MQKNTIWSLVIPLAWLALTLDFLAFAQETMVGETVAGNDNKLAAAQKCRSLGDNMQRLLCFDGVFDTPLMAVTAQEQADETASSAFSPNAAPPDAAPLDERPIGEMIAAMERTRQPGFEGWQVHVRRWQAGNLSWQGTMAAADLSDADLTRNNSERNPVDIFMTMAQAEAPADRPQSERAVLLISCDNDITTLGVLLPRPINSLSANLSLSGPGGVLHRLNWRNVESGSVVIAGRGLESIDTIKAIANYPRIQFQVAYPDGPRAFVFNMRDLKAHLRPFRIACHW